MFWNFQCWRAFLTNLNYSDFMKSHCVSKPCCQNHGSYEVTVIKTACYHHAISEISSNFISIFCALQSDFSPKWIFSKVNVSKYLVMPNWIIKWTLIKTAVVTKHLLELLLGAETQYIRPCRKKLKILDNFLVFFVAHQLQFFRTDKGIVGCKKRNLLPISSKQIPRYKAIVGALLQAGWQQQKCWRPHKQRAFVASRAMAGGRGTTNRRGQWSHWCPEIRCTPYAGPRAQSVAHSWFPRPTFRKRLRFLRHKQPWRTANSKPSPFLCLPPFGQTEFSNAPAIGLNWNPFDCFANKPRVGRCQTVLCACSLLCSRVCAVHQTGMKSGECRAVGFCKFR